MSTIRKMGNVHVLTLLNFEFQMDIYLIWKVLYVLCGTILFTTKSISFPELRSP